MLKNFFKKLKNIRNKNSQVEITEEEADLFDFIYFDADGQKRNFEEVLICIGLIVNKKGIPIDTRDTPRLNAAREIFNKKTFVKKDKLFVSASKKISGFLSKARWENAVESYKNMLNHSVLLGLYVSLLKPKTDFKYDDNNLTYTKDNLVSYSVQARLCSTSVLDDADKQMIAKKYKHITETKDDNKSRSDYWIEKPKYVQAHKAYKDAEKKLLEDLKSFSNNPTTAGLKSLLSDCVTYISCNTKQYGWQFRTTRSHYALDGDKEKSNQEADKLHRLMDEEEEEYKSNLRNSLDTIYQKVPKTYSDFYNQIENYYQDFDSLRDNIRLEKLNKLLETCPEDIDFTNDTGLDNEV